MAEPGRLAGLRVMVVEDEALVAMMLEDMLASMGCVVVAMAASLARGLALAEDEALALDAAVLDVNLGGQRAYPIAAALTARRVPFLFSTGYGPHGLDDTFAAIPTLSKPFEAAQLEAMLLGLVEGAG